jgi:hypothetical protein
MGLYEDDFELTKFYLGNIYRTKLSMHTRRKHNYLGMDMEFNNNGTLEVSMITYFEKNPAIPRSNQWEGNKPSSRASFDGKRQEGDKVA